MMNQQKNQQTSTTQSDFVKNINLEKFCLQEYLSVERVFGLNANSQKLEQERKLKFGL